MKRHLLKIFLTVLLVFFVPGLSHAGQAYFCIQCHTAAQVNAMAGRLPGGGASLYRASHDPCPALSRMKTDMFLTESRILRTQYVISQPGAWGRQGLAGFNGELDRLYILFEDVKSGYPANLSAGAVTGGLAGINAEVNHIWNEVDGARNGIKDGKAIGAGALGLMLFAAAAFPLFKKLFLSRGKSVLPLLAFLASLVLLSCASSRSNEAFYSGQIAKADAFSEKSENTAWRSWEAARLAFITTDGAESDVLVSKAVTMARSLAAPDKIRYSQTLIQQSAQWPAYWRMRAMRAAQRLATDAGTGWPLRAIGSVMAQAGRDDEAKKLILASAAISDRLAAHPYRDYELKAASVDLCGFDLRDALAVSEKISSPLIKVAALREMGERLGSVLMIRSALSRLEQAGPVRAGRFYKKTIESGKIAVALTKAGDRDSAKQAIDFALATASSLGPDMKSFALDALAGYAAQVDFGKALAIAGQIGKEFPEQRLDARLAVAGSKRNPAREELLSVINEAGQIKDIYIHDRILARAVSMLGETAPEEALKQSALNSFNFRQMRSRALSSAFARLLVDEKGGWQKEINAFIPDAYWRAQAYYRAASARAEDHGPGRTSALFSRAMREARLAKSEFLPWRIAMNWGALWLQFNDMPPGQLREELTSRLANLGYGTDVSGQESPGQGGEEDFARILRSAHPYFAAVWLDKIARRLYLAGETGAAREAYSLAVMKSRGIKDAFLRGEISSALAKNGLIIDNKKARAAFETALDAASLTGPLQGSSAP
ncbi:MAG: hypothetical protein M0018_08560 [Nitrospiraceae bacterium]|nr:hypothetical protein [Nitrospiraceae bacterium]